jgi:hypothetical protein
MHDDQTLLRAAVTVNPFTAADMLSIEKPQDYGALRERVRALFTFSPQRLVDYIASEPRLADELLGRSYDNRGTPAAYVEEIPGGYAVGWYDHGRSEVRRYTCLTDATADYVLLSWGMPRLAP